MAMLTREFPGSEIAVGMQLKHVATRALANTTTQGYTEPSPAWAQHLRTAISERRFERLAELFAADGRAKPIGYGPGADRLRETFAVIRAKAAEMRATNQAQRGDLRVELDLLRRTRLSVRFGKLNHCTMDDANPVGAKCLEDAIVPEGHQGPLIDRCQPSRCRNSVIAPRSPAHLDRGTSLAHQAARHPQAPAQSPGAARRTAPRRRPRDPKGTRCPLRRCPRRLSRLCARRWSACSAAGPPAPTAS
ncbi:hypothetical protein [Streptomyces ossamyceticus]|uniref:hypothetical protein n=1 Tax=Streptomyces ossamyceticus TaxID=249581 RepID=UPI001F0B2814|nr:hypothetical protein [Streptomyces ossamyceticus]